MIKKKKLTTLKCLEKTTVTCQRVIQPLLVTAQRQCFLNYLNYWDGQEGNGRFPCSSWSTCQGTGEEPWLHRWAKAACERRQTASIHLVERGIQNLNWACLIHSGRQENKKNQSYYKSHCHLTSGVDIRCLLCIIYLIFLICFTFRTQNLPHSQVTSGAIEGKLVANVLIPRNQAHWPIHNHGFQTGQSALTLSYGWNS